MKKTLIGIDIFICIVLGLLLIFTAYGGNVDPRTWTLPSVAVLLFPLALTVTVLLLIINIFFSKICTAINIVSLIICIKSILYFCPLNIIHSETEGDSFSLMTYNIMALTDFNSALKTATDNPTLEFILNSGKDIVALQECYTLDITNDGSHVDSSLKERLKERYPYIDIAPSGQAILSVYPIKKINHAYSDDSNLRVGVYEVYIDNDTVSLINVHLQSIGLTQSDKELYMQLTEGQTENENLKRELKDIRKDLLGKLSKAFRLRAVQIEKIKEIANGLNGKIIVCGDFNDVTLCYACRVLLNDNFKDAYRKAGLGPAITYHDNRFYFRIDHVFFKGGLRALEAHKEQNSSSDHYPLAVNFCFKT